MPKVKLEACCKETLNAIRDKKEIGEAMSDLLKATPFLQIFAGLNPVELLLTVATSDYEEIAKAMKNVGEITRLSIRRDIEIEIVKHPKNKELKEFWKNLLDTMK